LSGNSPRCSEADDLRTASGGSPTNSGGLSRIFGRLRFERFPPLAVVHRDRGFSRAHRRLAHHARARVRAMSCACLHAHRRVQAHAKCAFSMRGAISPDRAARTRPSGTTNSERWSRHGLVRSFRVLRSDHRIGPTLRAGVGGAGGLPATAREVGRPSRL
jgi:hypothetical protein